jgi:hypothetical protein
LTEIGSKRRMITGLFILVALAFLGYNGSKLMTLLDSPLIGVSSESKLAREKWHHLEMLASRDKERRLSKPIPSLVQESLSRKFSVEESASGPEVRPGRGGEIEIPLEVTGIIGISGSNGRSRTAAIIGDRVFYVNETVQGYLIEKIMEKGISLTKDGRSWFVEAPCVPYSVDRGD